MLCILKNLYNQIIVTTQLQCSAHNNVNTKLQESQPKRNMHLRCILTIELCRALERGSLVTFFEKVSPCTLYSRMDLLSSIPFCCFALCFTPMGAHYGGSLFDLFFYYCLNPKRLSAENQHD